MSITLQNLLDEALYVHLKATTYDHLGTTDTQRQTRVAEIINRTVEEWLEACPQLNQTSTTVAVTAGDPTYAIPTDLHGLAIRRVENYDSGSDRYRDLKALQYLPPDEVESLPPSWRNGEYTASYPTHWGLDATAANIVLYPAPSKSNTLNVHYRAEPAEITQAQVATPASVTISVVPSRFQNVIALGVAAAITEPNNPADAAQLRGRFREKLTEAQKSLRLVLAEFQRRPEEYPHRIGGCNVSNLFRGFERRY